MACSTDRLSLMAGTYGRVYLCLSTFGTDKVHSLSLVWFAHPKVGHGSSASEPMGPSREVEYTMLAFTLVGVQVRSVGQYLDSGIVRFSVCVSDRPTMLSAT